VPTLMTSGPYRFFIVMRDCEERAHVHVTGGGGREAKCWLVPEVEIAAHRGYTRRELDRVERLGRVNAAMLLRRWNDECGTTVP
jgi:Domain of unknown function (DUF4160)